ncbi:hypothetical protein ACO0QE_003122 [Hanseniaspora vineae]
MIRNCARNSTNGFKTLLSQRSSFLSRSTKLNQSTLAFIETSSEGSILKHSQSALEASKKLNASEGVVAVLVGSSSEKAVPNLSKLAQTYNIQKILYNDNSALDHYSPELVTPFLQQILSNTENSGISHVLFSASAVGKNILPRLSASLNVQCVNDIVDIKDNKTYIRPIYAGNLLSTIENNQGTQLISIRSSAFPVQESAAQAEAAATAPQVVKIEYTAPQEVHAAEYVGSKLLESERPDLGSAQVIVSGGRGLKNKENFDKLMIPLADAFAKLPKFKNVPAAIGATRAAVDSGFCDNSLQIGQTGKVVAPELYVACGVSGAIQHLAGMKNSKIIVNINKEEDQPLQEIADYTLIGDVNAVLPELTEKLVQ